MPESENLYCNVFIDFNGNVDIESTRDSPSSYPCLNSLKNPTLLNFISINLLLQAC